MASAKCSKDNFFFILLENCDSHIKLSVVEMAKDNGIILLTIPPQTTHKLEPLNICVFGPFKFYYREAVSSFVRSNPRKTIFIYDEPKLL